MLNNYVSFGFSIMKLDFALENLLNILGGYGFGINIHEFQPNLRNGHLCTKITSLTGIGSYRRALYSIAFQSFLLLYMILIFSHFLLLFPFFWSRSSLELTNFEFIYFSFKGDKEEERASLLQAGRLNLAMCKIKVNDWMEARNLCDKVVEEDDKCIKVPFIYYVSTMWGFFDPLPSM